jgi:hypothetical protein
MLNRVEFEEVTPALGPAESGVGGSWPSQRFVWVYSKGQAPYQFRPCMDPCSPHEWPYNLQALRGTEDYSDILAWYCHRYPAVSRADLDLLVNELALCVGGRQISVEIHHDMDTQERLPWFLVWGFAKVVSDDEDQMMDVFRARCRASPLLRTSYDVVMVSFRAGSFEDRLVSEWG